MDNQIIQGDCLQKMKEMQENSIDFIVTDPPYGLNFMGKSWDSETPNVDIWKEALRICKPGAMLAAFGGSRTHHHLMIALEKAGWEIRDVVMYMYGSGFPKSHNISKAIDKENGTQNVVGEIKDRWTGKGNCLNFSTDREQEFCKVTEPCCDLAKTFSGYGTALKPAHETVICAQKPLSIKTEQNIIVGNLIKLWCQLCLMLPVNVAEKIFMLNNLDMIAALNFAQWNAEKKSNIQADLYALMDMSQLEKVLISCLNTVSSWKSILEDHWKNGNTSITSMKTKPIIDLKTLKYCLSQLTPLIIIQEEIKAPGSWLIALPAASYLNVVCESIKDIDIAFALENVLKEAVTNCPEETDLNLSPNYQPIIIAMKPLDGTFAQNAEKWGVAGINIDESRIEAIDQEKLAKNWDRETITDMRSGNYGNGIASGIKLKTEAKSGRWPANIILDEEAGEMLDEMTGISKSAKGKCKAIKKNPLLEESKGLHTIGRKTEWEGYGDSGGASRFFYCAKASSKERNKGLEAMELKENHFLHRGFNNPNFPDQNRFPKQNNHPTVKPLSLMKYILKLLAPPGNPVVLDPFAGSGSTLIAAKEMQIRYIGIEMQEDYCEIARKRLDSVKKERYLWQVNG